MTAEILCIGTELLLGNITNGNARWIAEQLAALGIPHPRQTVVGDNRERLIAAVRAAASVAETQERQMATSAAGRGKESVIEEQLSPGAAPRKAAAPKAVYRFNEGYTNAVRRPVRVREML